jgi:AcrR family transcriptional regulator
MKSLYDRNCHCQQKTALLTIAAQIAIFRNVPSRLRTRPVKSSGSLSAAGPNLNARKQEFVRNSIWETAIDLFAERGFDGTTIDEIVEAAGVSQRTFFRYFDSKADLMGRTGANLARALTQTIKACPPAYLPSQVIREAIVHVLAQAASYPRLEKIIQIAARYPAAKQAQASRTPEVQSAVAQAYARRMKHSRKGDPTPEIIAALTTSAFEIALLRWHASGRGDIEKTVDEVLNTMRHLLV